MLTMPEDVTVFSVDEDFVSEQKALTVDDGLLNEEKAPTKQSSKDLDNPIQTVFMTSPACTY